MNRKGGSGKTTTTAAVGQFLGAEGISVLLVDLDPQRSLSRLLGAGDQVRGELLGRVLDSPLPGVRFAPAAQDLLDQEAVLERDRLGLRKVVRRLEQLRGEADFVLVDTGPALSVLTFGSLAGADYALVPVPCEGLAVAALPETLKVVDQVRELENVNLKILAVVATRFDGRTGHAKAALQTLQDGLGKALAEEVIPATASIAGPLGAGDPMERGSLGGRSYRRLSIELAEKIGLM